MKRRTEIVQPSNIDTDNFMLITIINNGIWGRYGELGHLQISGDDCGNSQRTGERTRSTEPLQIKRGWDINHMCSGWLLLVRRP